MGAGRASEPRLLQGVHGGSGRCESGRGRGAGGGTLPRAALESVALAWYPPDGGVDDAAPANGPRIVREPDKVIVRKRTVIDFNDVTVEGELTRPEGSYVLNRNRTRFQSLVRLREDFNPELQKSADNL
ncbi:MAG: hypothetical protein NVS4B10_25750 [Myxococcales bacterium]